MFVRTVGIVGARTISISIVIVFSAGRHARLHAHPVYGLSACLCFDPRLSAVAILPVGLSNPLRKNLSLFVNPPLWCLTDQDMQIRWTACEALYNITKVARSRMLTYFDELFDALSKLSCDTSKDVREASQLLDRLLKDVVTEQDAPGIDVSGFINLVQERLEVLDSRVRQFLVSWMAVLESVPEIDLVAPLPKVFPGLMSTLADPNKKIRDATVSLLEELIAAIKRHENPDIVALTRILLPICKPEMSGQLSGAETETFTIALSWLYTFVRLAPGKMLAFAPPIAAIVLPLIEITPTRSTVFAELLGSLDQAVLDLVASANPAQIITLPLHGDSNDQDSADEASRLDSDGDPTSSRSKLEFGLKARGKGVTLDLRELVSVLTKLLAWTHPAPERHRKKKSAGSAKPARLCTTSPPLGCDTSRHRSAQQLLLPSPLLLPQRCTNRTCLSGVHNSWLLCSRSQRRVIRGCQRSGGSQCCTRSCRIGSHSNLIASLSHH